MEFDGSGMKWNFFGTSLCTNVNIVLNKNKIFIRKIKENEVGKDIAFNFKKLFNMQIAFRTNKDKFLFNM